MRVSSAGEGLCVAVLDTRKIFRSRRARARHHRESSGAGQRWGRADENGSRRL